MQICDTPFSNAGNQPKQHIAASDNLYNKRHVVVSCFEKELGT